MKNTNTPVHARAEILLRKFGWEPVRQFEPAKADAIGRGELFEIWQRQSAKVIQQVIVQFYADGNGCEFFMRGTVGNSWAEVESLLGSQPEGAPVAV